MSDYVSYESQVIAKAKIVFRWVYKTFSYHSNSGRWGGGSLNDTSKLADPGVSDTSCTDCISDVLFYNISSRIRMLAWEHNLAASAITWPILYTDL